MVLFGLIIGDISQVQRQIYLNTIYMYDAYNFHQVISYHSSIAILILRIKEECAAGNLRDTEFFFSKDNLTPVKCGSVLFSECSYETGYVRAIHNRILENSIHFSYICARLPLNTQGYIDTMS